MNTVPLESTHFCNCYFRDINNTNMVAVRTSEVQQMLQLTIYSPKILCGERSEKDTYTNVASK